MPREVSQLKKHIAESPKIRALKEKRMRRRRNWAIGITIAAVLVIGGAIYVMHLPRLHITQVSVEGNQVVDTEAVISATNTYLAGAYIYVIPRKLFFAFPKEEMIAGLLETFPRFKSVTVTRTDIHTLHVAVDEVRGRALWCGMDATVRDVSSPCYFTDAEAKIVSLAPYYSGNVFPRFFGVALPIDTTDPLGETFAEAKNFQDLLVFYDSVSGLGFNVGGIVIGEKGEDELVLDVGTSSAPLRFRHDADYAQLATDFSAAIAQTELSQSLAKNKQNLEYFDLRFDNKVYFKFRGE